MKKFRMLLLILSLIAIALSLSSCSEGQGTGNFLQTVLETTVGTETPFGKQMLYFKPFMQAEAYFDKLIDFFKSTPEYFLGPFNDAQNFEDYLKAIIHAIVSVLPWVGSIGVYIACIFAMSFFDVMLMFLYALVFIVIYLVYLINSLLLLLV